MKKLFYRLLSTQLILFSLTSVNIYAQDEFFTPKTTIGGYGELHFNHQSINSRKSKDVLDFHRFVTFMSYTWSGKWSFKAEIELEHNIVEGEKGALELEQAFVNYRFRDWLAFKAGVILPSIGLINEYHEPPTFLSVERPAYNKYIIPPLDVVIASREGVVAEFADKELEVEWQKYHQLNAKLRAISKVGNLQLSKVRVPWEKIL